MSFNIIDIIIVVIFLVFGVLAYNRGLIITLFNLMSSIISLVLAYLIHPQVSFFIKNNVGIREKFKDGVIKFIGLDTMVAEQTRTAQTELINGLNLPSFLKKTLLENNNPESYKILDVSGIEQYIGDYVSDILVNILSIVVVFFVVFMIMRIISSSLNIFAKLPVINTMNKFGGVVLGLLQAGIVVWIGLMIVSLFISNPNFANVVQLINSSVLAKYFYNTDILFEMVLKLIPA